MQASMKHVHVSLSGEPVTYVGIRQILDEMIYNICENAIKYNVEGGSVSVWAGNTLNGPKVQVNDTGIGIPKEHQERIFERFYRVDKSHSKERGGTGLGLSIVKHGALLHNAKVSVESDTGKEHGWKFCLRHLSQSDGKAFWVAREILLCRRAKMWSNPESRLQGRPA